jgi:hypothetical protein
MRNTKTRLTTYFVPSHLETIRVLSSSAALPFSTALSEAIDMWVEHITGKSQIERHDAAFWKTAAKRAGKKV